MGSSSPIFGVKIKKYVKTTTQSANPWPPPRWDRRRANRSGGRLALGARRDGLGEARGNSASAARKTSGASAAMTFKGTWKPPVENVARGLTWLTPTADSMDMCIKRWMHTSSIQVDAYSTFFLHPILQRRLKICRTSVHTERPRNPRIKLLSVEFPCLDGWYTIACFQWL